MYLFTIVPNLNVSSNPKESEACNLMIRHVKIDLIGLRIDINYWFEGQYSICELNSHINELIEKTCKNLFSIMKSNLDEKEIHFFFHYIISEPPTPMKS
jgi:hypothetical protein